VREEPAKGHVPGVDADLDLMIAVVKALRDLTSDPDKAQDSARVYDFSIRWGTLLHGRLERLAYYHGRGELTPQQQERYQALCTQLRHSLPLIERLGLARPGLPQGNQNVS
jgi:hypothetical protein